MSTENQQKKNKLDELEERIARLEATVRRLDRELSIHRPIGPGPGIFPPDVNPFELSEESKEALKKLQEELKEHNKNAELTKSDCRGIDPSIRFK